MEAQELVVALLSFLPASVRPWVELAAVVITGLSALLVAARPFLAKVPAGPARAWIDALDKWLGILAVNSKPLVERVAKPAERKKS